MDFEWPSYDHERLDDGRAWSAKFSSWDQRKDDIYYNVTLHEDGGDLPPFAIVFATSVPESEWDRPDFAARLLRDMVRLVAAGKTNIVYHETVW